MKSAFRTTMLTAALAAACASGAFAAPVVLDLNFDALGDKAALDDKTFAVGSISGINFQGAFAYKNTPSMTTNELGLSGSNKTGFIANSKDFQTSSIVLTLDPQYTGRYFDSISASLSVFDTFKLVGTDVNGITETKQFSTSNGGALWSPTEAFSFILDQIISVAFVPANGGVGGFDNLQITLTDTVGGGGGGGTVPEPASYALVGLALLAAGSASRRRS